MDFNRCDVLYYHLALGFEDGSSNPKASDVRFIGFFFIKLVILKCKGWISGENH